MRQRTGGSWVSACWVPQVVQRKQGMVSSPSPGDLTYRIEQPFDLLLGRVAGAADPHQALRCQPQTLDRRRGVEVTVRGEQAPLGQSAGDLAGRDVGDRERNRR